MLARCLRRGLERLALFVGGLVLKNPVPDSGRPRRKLLSVDAANDTESLLQLNQFTSYNSLQDPAVRILRVSPYLIRTFHNIAYLIAAVKTAKHTACKHISNSQDFARSDVNCHIKFPNRHLESLPVCSHKRYGRLVPELAGGKEC
jgi:hypothetical protein